MGGVDIRRSFLCRLVKLHIYPCRSVAAAAGSRENEAVLRMYYGRRACAPSSTAVEVGQEGGRPWSRDKNMGVQTRLQKNTEPRRREGRAAQTSNRLARIRSIRPLQADVSSTRGGTARLTCVALVGLIARTDHPHGQLLRHVLAKTVACFSRRECSGVYGADQEPTT